MPSFVRSSLPLLSVAVALLAATACRQTQAPSEQPVASAKASATSAVAPPATATAPQASGAPIAKLVPPSRQGPRASCPLTIEPGVGFGPVLLGETLSDLSRAGLKIKQESETFALVELAEPSSTKLRVQLCQGKVIEVALDDLRKGPECVQYAGKAIPRAMPRADIEAALGGCESTPPRTGGAFERCQQGGVYVGHGMGDFVQLRVMPKGWPFDDTCSIASDDGSLVDLSADERVDLLKKVLLLREISPHWHVDKPGRDPLRIVKTPLVRTEALTMFGSPVSWIDESEAKAGTAFLRVTRLDATKTKATAEFAYPIEGVKGTATFKRSGREWQLEQARVSER